MMPIYSQSEPSSSVWRPSVSSLARSFSKHGLPKQPQLLGALLLFGGGLFFFYFERSENKRKPCYPDMQDKLIHSSTNCITQSKECSKHLFMSKTSHKNSCKQQTGVNNNNFPSFSRHIMTFKSHSTTEELYRADRN